MSFFLRLIGGMALLGGLFAVMYAGLLLMAGPVPRYNLIVPKVTDDLVQFCEENVGVKVFKPVEGIKSISSDAGSICLPRHERFFLASSLEAIEFDERASLNGSDCLEGQGPKRSGWYRYTKADPEAREASSASSADAASSEHDRVQIRFEAIEQRSARYHIHYYEDPPVRYDEKRALLKSGVAMHDMYTDERVAEAVEYRVSPRREYYQPIVAFFRIEYLYTPLMYKFPCNARLGDADLTLLEVTINSNNAEL